MSSKKILVKQQQSYYDQLWAEWNRQGEQPDINWTYHQRRIHNQLIRILGDHINIPIKILEIGIGKGDLAFKISTQIGYRIFEYIGIDLSKKGLKIASQKLPKTCLIVADATCLPFKEYYFDIVICSEVIEHIIEKEKLIREIKKTLKPHGILLMTTPNPKSLSYILPRIISMFKKMEYGSNQPVNDLIEQKKLIELLHRNGFIIVNHSALIYNFYSVTKFENLIKRPLMVIRKISEYLEKKDIFSNLGLYQVVVAKKKDYR